MDSKLLKDIAERTFWTLAQVGVAFAIVHQADLPQEYVVLIAPLLAVAKGTIAKKIGDPTDASINPLAKQVAETVASVATKTLETEVAPKIAKKAAPAKKTVAPAKKSAK